VLRLYHKNTTIFSCNTIFILSQRTGYMLRIADAFDSEYKLCSTKNYFIFSIKTELHKSFDMVSRYKGGCGACPEV